MITNINMQRELTIHNNLSHWKITKDYRENIIFCKRSQSDELTSVDICMSNKKTASFVFFSIIIFQFKQRIKHIYASSEYKNKNSCLANLF